MAILFLKIAELTFMEKKSAEKPILLLDDIFSELDRQHRSQVLSLVDKQQTILTTTGKLVRQNDNASIGALANALANNQEIKSLERP